MRVTSISVLILALESALLSQLHDYHFIPLKVNWSQAQTYCRNHNTDLATAHSKEDNDNLLKVLADESGWIGLHRTSSTSPLVWSDRSNSTFADWDVGQPNNNNGAQWCVHVLNNLWSDTGYKCTFFLCVISHVFPTERKRTVVRLEVKGQSLKDPEVKRVILVKVEHFLKEGGLTGSTHLSWRTQSDGEVFQSRARVDDAEKEHQCTREMSAN